MQFLFGVFRALPIRALVYFNMNDIYGFDMTFDISINSILYIKYP